MLRHVPVLYAPVLPVLLCAVAIRLATICWLTGVQSPNKSTVSVLYSYFITTVVVLYLYFTTTVFVLYLYSITTVFVLNLYLITTVFVLYCTLSLSLSLFWSLWSPLHCVPGFSPFLTLSVLVLPPRSRGIRYPGRLILLDSLPVLVHIVVHFAAICHF